MVLFGYVLSGLIAVGIMFLGLRFLWAPAAAVRDFGIPNSPSLSTGFVASDPAAQFVKYLFDCSLKHHPRGEPYSAATVDG
jgi:hypothetical protein